MYRIGLIENEPEKIREFQNTLDEYFEIDPINLTSNIKDLIFNILENSYDALIIDYKLSDNRPDIQYNGVDIYNQIAQERLQFPSIILTSFEAQISDPIEEPFNIVDKALAFHKTDLFIKKFNNKIRTYKNNIEKAQSDFKKLLAKKQLYGLSISEEEELVKLDDYLEKTIHGSSKLPRGFKHESALEKLSKIVDLISKIEEENEVSKKKPRKK